MKQILLPAIILAVVIVLGFGPVQRRPEILNPAVVNQCGLSVEENSAYLTFDPGPSPSIDSYNVMVRVRLPSPEKNPTFKIFLPDANGKIGGNAPLLVPGTYAPDLDVMFFPDIDVSDVSNQKYGPDFLSIVFATLLNKLYEIPYARLNAQIADANTNFSNPTFAPKGELVKKFPYENDTPLNPELPRLWLSKDNSRRLAIIIRWKQSPLRWDEYDKDSFKAIDKKDSIILVNLGDQIHNPPAGTPTPFTEGKNLLIVPIDPNLSEPSRWPDWQKLVETNLGGLRDLEPLQNNSTYIIKFTAPKLLSAAVTELTEVDSKQAQSGSYVNTVPSWVEVGYGDCVVPSTFRFDLKETQQDTTSVDFLVGLGKSLSIFFLVVSAAILLQLDGIPKVNARKEQDGHH